jgi:hypothetical protein
MTNLTHNSFLCVYFNSLHVSSNLVLIIRRINCINTTSGICHSVSVNVSCKTCTVNKINKTIIYAQYDAVGIATRYGLGGPGIESRWERFSAPVQTGPGVHSACYTMGTGSFPRVKRPGRGVDHPPPSGAEVQERVELYIFSASGPSWCVLGWTLPSLLYDAGLQPSSYNTAKNVTLAP